MKKIILSFIGLLLVVLTIHFSTPFYGGIPGIISRVQGRVITKISVVTHDPGACGLIRGYWLQSLRHDLRERCIENYVQNVVQTASDCKTEYLVADMSHLSPLFLRDEYRYKCLIRHFQTMLGNTLTQEWLPVECINIRDKLIIMEHYMADLKASRGKDYDLDHTVSPFSPRDLSILNQCEGFLDTPKIYSFLRDITPSTQEREYIESQKKRVFELK